MLAERDVAARAVVGGLELLADPRVVAWAVDLPGLDDDDRRARLDPLLGGAWARYLVSS